MSYRAVAVLLACGSVLLGGCAETEVRVVFDADPGARSGFTTMTLRIWDGDGSLVRQRTVTPAELDGFPAEARLVPRGSDSTNGYRIVAQLFGTTGCPASDECEQARQEAIGSYVSDESRVIRLRFDDACAQVLCSPGQTCVQGVCEGACFTPQPDSDASRSIGEPCPVGIDSESGRDDPELCVLPSSPCQTVSFALGAYGGGTVYQLRGSSPGSAQLVYEPFFVRTPASGTADAPTVLRAWPGTGIPRIDGGGSTTPTLRIGSMDGASHVVVEDLEVTGSMDSGVSISGGGAQIVVRRCRVFDNGDGGIRVTGAFDGVRIEDNEVSDNRGASNPSVGGIEIRDEGCTDCQILGNTLVDNNTGANIRDLGTRTRIEGNTTIGGQRGISMSGPGGLAQNNRVCGSRFGGVTLRPPVGQVVFQNNSVVDGEGGAVNVMGDAVVIQNVLAFHTGAGLRADVPETPDNRCNLYYMNSEAVGSNITQSDPSSDLIDTVEPLFVDRAACDLSLVQPVPPPPGCGPLGSE